MFTDSSHFQKFVSQQVFEIDKPIDKLYKPIGHLISLQLNFTYSLSGNAVSVAQVNLGQLRFRSVIELRHTVQPVSGQLRAVVKCGQLLWEVCRCEWEAGGMWVWVRVWVKLWTVFCVQFINVVAVAVVDDDDDDGA